MYTVIKRKKATPKIFGTMLYKLNEFLYSAICLKKKRVGNKSKKLPSIC